LCSVRGHGAAPTHRQRPRAVATRRHVRRSGRVSALPVPLCRRMRSCVGGGRRPWRSPAAHAHLAVLAVFYDPHAHIHIPLRLFHRRRRLLTEGWRRDEVELEGPDGEVGGDGSNALILPSKAKKAKAATVGARLRCGMTNPDCGCTALHGMLTANVASLFGVHQSRARELTFSAA